MKNLSSQARAAVDCPFVEPIRLLTIELDAATVRLCDRVFGQAGSECVFDGQLYEPIVLSWGEIACGRLDPATWETTAPGQCTVVIDNTTPVGGAACFSALFKPAAPHFARVKICEIYSQAAAAGDAVCLFVGQIEDVINMAADQVTLLCSSFELAVANRFAHTILCAEDFPGADPDDLGKMIPQVWGRARKVPCLAVDAGGKSTLVTAMTADSPGNGGTLELSDASAFPTGAHVIQVDGEQIAVASRAGNILTLASSGARGHNGTEATDHDAGSAVAEIQTDYVYLAADHPVQAIDAVYVDHIRQVDGFTAYTGRPNDELSGYPGRAAVVFHTLPVFKKQVNLAAHDTIDVKDTIGVDDTIGVKDTIGVTQGSHAHSSPEVIVNWRFDVVTGTSGSSDPLSPWNLCDNDYNSVCGFDALNSWAVIGKASYQDYAGPPTAYRLCMACGAIHDQNTSPNRQIYMSFGSGGLTAYPNNSGQVIKGSWIAVNSDTNTWEKFNGLKARIEKVYGGNGADYIREAWIEVKYTPATNSSPAAGVGKTGAATKSGAATKTGAPTKTGTVTISGNSTAETVIGNRVSCDLRGRIDADGSITGTAGALIERPDHICADILIRGCQQAGEVIDSAAYAAAGARYAAAGFTLAVVLLQRPCVRALVDRIAFQSRSIEYWEAGSHRLKYIPVREQAAATIGRHHVDQDSLQVSFTDRVDIKNTLTARYARDWSGYEDPVEALRATVTAEHTASADRYGPLSGDPLSLPYVMDSGQAGSVLAWQLEDLAAPRLVVTLTGGYGLAAIERGDVVTFDVASQPLSAALLGLVASGDRFRVIDKSYLVGGLKLQAVALNYWVYRKDLAAGYDILAATGLAAGYDILAQASAIAGYDIHANQTATAGYDILARIIVSGRYDIQTRADGWGNSDTWGDSDAWGGAII